MTRSALGAVLLSLALLAGCTEGSGAGTPPTAAPRAAAVDGSASAAVPPATAKSAAAGPASPSAAGAPGATAKSGATAPTAAAAPAAGAASGARSGAVPAVAATVDVQVVAHEIEVTLDPETHGLTGKDVLRVRFARAGIDRVHFLLNEALAVTSVSVSTRAEPKPAAHARAAVNVFADAGAPPASGTNVSANPGDASPFPHGAACIEVRLPEPAAAGEAVLVVAWEGKLYAPPEAPEKVRFVVGERTAATIGTEGIYLSPEGAWYPIVPGSFPTFTVAARTPAGWEVVGQDQRVARREEGGRLHTVWSSTIPADGYTLVAGRYVVTNDTVDGIELSTYLFESEKELAPAYLQAAKQFLGFFNQLLTRYPYRRFSIVENFFATGYGMPSYTLLGRDVVRMGGRYLGASGLGHEILHCWWGNFVFVDPQDGNWCEGLTSYCSNYYHVEATEEPAKAREARRHTLTRFAALVAPGADYPVRKFQGKTTEIDNEVGYSKCSFIFHAVRRRVGDAAFWSGLRRLILEKGGSAANWNDIRLAFETVSGQDLKPLFGEMLDRAGAPEVRLGPTAVVQRSREPERYMVSATLEQAGEPWRVSLPVVIRTALGDRTTVVELAEASRSFEFELESAPQAIRIDPESHLFRRLVAGEVRPCLNRTMNDRQRLVVLPGRAVEPAAAAFKSVADKLAAEGGWKVVADAAVGAAELAGNSLLVLGGPEENTVAARALRAPGFAGPTLRPDAVGFGERVFSAAGNAFLVSGENPFAPGRTITVFWGMTPAAAQKATRLLFYYGWKGWYAFDEGKRIEEGDLAPEGRPLEHEFSTPPGGGAGTGVGPGAGAGGGAGAGDEAGGDGSGELDAKNLIETVRFLCAPELEGRGLATAGGRAAAEHVGNAFRAAGLKPLGRGGSFLTDVDVVAREPGGPNTLEARFAPAAAGVAADAPRAFTFGKDFVPLVFTPNGRASGPLVFAGYGISAPDAGYDDYAGLDVQGKIVLVLTHAPREGDAEGPFRTPARARLATEAAKARAAEERGAVAVLIALDAQHANFPPDDLPAATWQDFLPKKLKDRLAMPEAGKQNWTAEYLAVSAQSRAVLPDEPVKIPCFVVSREAADALLAPSGTTVAQAGSKLDATMRPESSAVKGVTVTCESLVGSRRIPTQNVVGLLEGGDPELAKEYVILGAHHDHLGRGPEGRYFAGANDNASGVAALVEVARVLATAKQPPRRSVIFVAFGGEEWGLWGSRAYVASPPAPLKRTVAMVNLDMLARGEPKDLYVIGVLRNPEFYDLVQRVNGRQGMNLKGTIEFAFPWGSDHYPFHQERVAALDLTSSLFPGYHTEDDTPDKLAPAKLVRATALVLRVMRELAGTDVRFPPPKEVEVPFPQRKPGGGAGGAGGGNAKPAGDGHGGGEGK
ncbi:MAG: M20/M25/M40 family metallo-hydrolase [Planctomycetes bacterium]|nr:M20/M25/M40 family metallo-hydrolase [Planctomycetota bacterium]